MRCRFTLGLEFSHGCEANKGKDEQINTVRLEEPQMLVHVHVRLEKPLSTDQRPNSPEQLKSHRPAGGAAAKVHLDQSETALEVDLRCFY